MLIYTGILHRIKYVCSKTLASRPSALMSEGWGMGGGHKACVLNKD